MPIEETNVGNPNFREAIFIGSESDKNDRRPSIERGVIINGER